jgi:NAD(P) transhydrogenase subunit alpha
VSREAVLGIYVFVMAIFVGFEVIARVPSVLHTPLMSATNAIHGIVLLGAMLVAGAADTALLHALGFIAVVLGAANVFGGFAVTDRMLEMFKPRRKGESAPR